MTVVSLPCTIDTVFVVKKRCTSLTFATEIEVVKISEIILIAFYMHLYIRIYAYGCTCMHKYEKFYTEGWLWLWQNVLCLRWLLVLSSLSPLQLLLMTPPPSQHQCSRTSVNMCLCVYLYTYLHPHRDIYILRGIYLGEYILLEEKYPAKTNLFLFFSRNCYSQLQLVDVMVDSYFT